MSVPGFSAEASLYRSATRYHMAAPVGVLAGSTVFPQLTTCYPCSEDGRQICCVNEGLLHFCYWKSCDVDPCAGLTPEICKFNPRRCCECAGGNWTGTQCV